MGFLSMLFAFCVIGLGVLSFLVFLVGMILVIVFSRKSKGRTNTKKISEL